METVDRSARDRTGNAALGPIIIRKTKASEILKMFAALYMDMFCQKCCFP